MQSKWIFHIDIDSFFVSASLILKPHLKNKPIVIISRKQNKYSSLVLSASYEAKKYGVKVASTYKTAKSKCPDLEVEYANYSFYSYISNKFFNLLEIYSNRMEKMSIDEAYLDVTHRVTNENQALKLAKEIQQVVSKELSLPITIGIAHNLFMAKMATNLAKPFGTLYLHNDNYQQYIFNLDIEEFLYIGKHSTKQLKALGIKKIGQLAQMDIDDPNLNDIFGIRTWSILKNIKNQGMNFVNSYSTTKSISSAYTLLSNIEEITLEYISEIIKGIVNKIFWDLKNQGLYAKQFVLSYTNYDGKIKSKSTNNHQYVASYQDLTQIAFLLFKHLGSPLNIKTISFGCSNFSINKSISIFDNQEISKIDYLIEEINFKLKKRLLFKASNLSFKKDNK